MLGGDAEMTTVVILDCALCGTSMLAGLVHRLGIPMVRDNCRLDKMEDLDIRDALQKEADFARLVQERSGADWGFKWSELARFAAWFKAYLENPIYLAIYKDPVSIAWRRHQEINAKTALDSVLRMRDSLTRIIGSGLPVHILSYTEAVTSPLVFVRRLASIIRVDADERTIAHAATYIQPGGYQESM
jgi:hypothetical protein